MKPPWPVSKERWKSSPTTWRLWWSAAGSYNLESYEEALANFDRALELSPSLAQLRPDAGHIWFYRGCTLGILGRYDEAAASLDRSLTAQSDGHSDAIKRITILQMKFLMRLEQANEDLAKREWREILAPAERPENWQEVVSTAALQAAGCGYLSLARQIISESGLEEQLFPLARSVDYLLTGEEALIEKLSPEVRRVVDEIVAKLRSAGGRPQESNKKSRRRRAKPGLRARTVKQLR